MPRIKGVEIHYKTLKYAYGYMDINRLSGGLYEAMKPCILDNDATYESIKAMYDSYAPMLSGQYMPEQFEENLRKCVLEDIVIVRKEEYDGLVECKDKMMKKVLRGGERIEDINIG